MGVPVATLAALFHVQRNAGLIQVLMPDADDWTDQKRLHADGSVEKFISPIYTIDGQTISMGSTIWCVDHWIMAPAGWKSYIYTSPDGINWTKRNTLDIGGTGYADAFQNDGYNVVFGAEYTHPLNFLFSTDGGMTWTNPASPEPAAQWYGALAVIGNKVIVGYLNYPTNVAVLQDIHNPGAGWAKYTCPSIPSMFIYRNGVLYALTLSDPAAIYQSTNFGQTWTQIVNNLPATGDGFDNNLYYSNLLSKWVLGAGATGRIFLSSDLATWTEVASLGAVASHIMDIGGYVYFASRLLGMKRLYHSPSVGYYTESIVTFGNTFITANDYSFGFRPPYSADYPEPPVVTSALALVGQTGVPFSYTIMGTNNPTGYDVAGTLPAGLSLNRSTGRISGTPTAAGTTLVNCDAANWGGLGRATLTFAISVGPPVITSASTLTGLAGTVVGYQVTATNSPTSYSATGLPDGLTINTVGGQIIGVPTQAGTFNATISATNAGGTGSAPLTITIPAARAIAVGSSLTPNLYAGSVWTPLAVIPGKTLGSVCWSGTKWFAACTDGTVHSSLDGVTWTFTGHAMASYGRVSAVGNVVAVVNWGISIDISLDGGSTWVSHTPYGGSPFTYGVHVHSLGGGVCRIFALGQSGVGYTSGIITSVDTNALPSPGSAWPVRFTGLSATVFDLCESASGSVAAVTSLSNGHIGVLTTADVGLTWAVVDTGLVAVNGRSIFWSPTSNVYFIGSTDGGATGKVHTSANLSSFATLYTDLGGAVDQWTEVDGLTFCMANAGGAWQISPSTHTKVITGTVEGVAAV
ncbi:MAG: Ig domain-containing protein [Phycisphaerae bacterium]|jgi:hypothetical protein